MFLGPKNLGPTTDEKYSLEAQMTFLAARIASAGAAQLNSNLGFGPEVHVAGGRITTTTSTTPPCRYGEACQQLTNSTAVLVTHLVGTGDYDGGSGWVAGPPLNVARWGHAMASMGGRIYAVGGCTGASLTKCEGPLGSVEVLDPVLGTWEVMTTALHVPRGRLALAAVSTTLVAVGGEDGDGTGSRAIGGLEVGRTVEVYTAAVATWRLVAPMAAHRCGLGAAALGGLLCAPPASRSGVPALGALDHGPSQAVGRALGRAARP